MNIDVLVSSILDSIVDPLTGMHGKDMGLYYTNKEEADVLNITIHGGFPTLFLQHQYASLAQQVLEQQLPHKKITLNTQQNIRTHKTQLPGKGLRGVKNVIAVASGKGGVGKSTVTSNLAVALAKFGARVGILDADIYGPSIPLMLGAQGPATINQDDLYYPIMAHGVQTMSIGYLTNVNQALIWRGPMLAKSLLQMLDCTQWNELDYLFIDLPPGTGDIQLTLVQKIPLTTAIVVTTPQNVATLDAQKALIMFEKTNVDVLGIVENMATHLCSVCGHEEAIFGTGGAQVLCNTKHYPLLGQLPLNGVIRAQCDLGIPVTAKIMQTEAEPFIKTAMRCAIELAIKEC